MSKKIPYVQMKLVYEEMLNNVFNDSSTSFHGWTKSEFMGMLMQEIIAEAEEETYDIAIAAPTTIQ